VAVSPDFSALLLSSLFHELSTLPSSFSLNKEEITMISKEESKKCPLLMGVSDLGMVERSRELNDGDLKTRIQTRPWLHKNERLKMKSWSGG
jgi:hypothetical protein